MESSDAERFDPGTAPYGNFINYYSFNSVEDRIKAIPDHFLQKISSACDDIVCLDVGCNAGDLTVALYCFLEKFAAPLDKQIFILGIDLDETLITRSKESNPYPANIMYIHTDIMTDACSDIFYSYLCSHDRLKFDLVTCFSVTMWIHLHHGDSGLDRFLNYVCGIAMNLLIEPQEWKCYQKAVRRMKRGRKEIFDLKALNVRRISEHIHNILHGCGMRGLTRSSTSWNRKLYIFERIAR